MSLDRAHALLDEAELARSGLPPGIIDLTFLENELRWAVRRAGLDVSSRFRELVEVVGAER